MDHLRGLSLRTVEALIDSGVGRGDQLRMCNRYQPGERQNVRLHFSARELRNFNDGPAIVHPRDVAPVVRLHEGERVIEQMSWGFPVVLTREQGEKLQHKPVNNARFDKLDKFWHRWAREPSHRCIIPAAAYAEAMGEPGEMCTTWLHPIDQPLFAWAGLWCDSPEWGGVFTGVMTDCCPEHAKIHDRAPVNFEPSDWETWLTAPLDDLKRFDRPLPAERVRVEHTGDLWFRPKGA